MLLFTQRQVSEVVVVVVHLSQLSSPTLAYVRVVEVVAIASPAAPVHIIEHALLRTPVPTIVVSLKVLVAPVLLWE